MAVEDDSLLLGVMTAPRAGAKAERVSSPPVSPTFTSKLFPASEKAERTGEGDSMTGIDGIDRIDNSVNSVDRVAVVRRKVGKEEEV